MTLEEEFRKHFGNDIDGENLIQGIISFISSREEKAREEGRKEGYIERIMEKVEPYPITRWNCCVGAITQYKEELLGKIDAMSIKPDEYSTNGTVAVLANSDRILSEVKKLL